MPRPRFRYETLRRAVPLALAVAAFAPEAAYASTCEILAKRIRVAEASTGGGALANAKLIARQRTELRKTRALQRKHLCALRSDATCQQLNDARDAMVKRIAKLEKRTKPINLDALRGEWKNAGCSANARKKTKPKSEIASAPAPRSADPIEPKKTPPPKLVATICVRTCDGYFFPVSNAIAITLTPNDSRRCAALCPTATTRLYIRPVNGQVEEMVDRSGLPYSAQRFAFRHQAEDYEPNKRCSCGTPDQSVLEPSATAAGQSIPIPRDRAVMTGDRETRRNASVSFGWERARAFAKPKDTSERVRVVGRPFVPDR